MTDDEVISAVVRYVALMTNVRAIRTHAGKDPPEQPYVAVNFLGSNVVRQHEQTIEYVDTGVDNTAGKETVTATPVLEMEWRFSVHAYGPEPTGILRRLISASRLSQPSEPLYPELVIHSHSSLRSIPEMINSVWEPRAQIDLFVRGIIRDEFTVDVIDKATFEHQKMA